MLTEQRRLLVCGEQLQAKGAVRWGPAFESGAILCEALCWDQLALAGAITSPPSAHPGVMINMGSHYSISGLRHLIYTHTNPHGTTTTTTTGNGHLHDLFQDAAGLMVASFQHATLPSLLLAS